MQEEVCIYEIKSSSLRNFNDGKIISRNKYELALSYEHYQQWKHFGINLIPNDHYLDVRDGKAPITSGELALFTISICEPVYILTEMLGVLLHAISQARKSKKS